MAKRIRIFFVNCPTLATDAAAFLILAQNKEQVSIQFEIHHFWIYGLRTQIEQKGWWDKKFSIAVENFKCLPWLERRYKASLDLRAAPYFRDCLKHDSCLIVSQEMANNYHKWLLDSGYNSFDCKNDAAIIITETPLQDGYISYCGENVGIVSVANWKRLYKPVSAIEYILASVQRLSLRLCYGLQMGSHYPTRGCLWDFDVHQSDFRISAFLGFLCETCRERLKIVASPDEYEDINRLIENKWVGDAANLPSVAGMLAKNYRYDLSRSTGLNPGLWSKITKSMQSEFGKYAFEILKWVTVLLLTVAVVRFFPAIAKFLTK